MKEALKVGISGVRGVVGEAFTPQLAAAFAQAFGAFVGRGTVVVGRDTRPSGLMFEHAVIAGLQSVGCRPVLLGIVPTPTVLLATLTLGARGGIAITASHNPAPWNALKFVDAHGRFLSALRAEEFFDIYHQQQFPLVAEADLPPAVRHDGAVAEHLRRVVDYVDAAAIRAARLRVAVDCCNGVGCLASPALLCDRLGCTVTTIFDRPTGRFEREPEPLPANLGELGRAVRDGGCAVGFAQDPDGDRLAIVDERGEAIGEDLTLALCARQVLDDHAAGPVAINLSTSKAVEAVARARGAQVIRTPIGETHVTEAMLRHGCVIGGESNGGVIVPAIHPCRDSFAAMAIVLELLATTGQSLSELRDEIPRFVIVRDKLVVRAEDTSRIVRELRRRHAGRPVNLLDGLFVDFGDSWLHVRRSNTEPVIRITAEAPSRPEAEALARATRAEIESRLAAPPGAAGRGDEKG